MRPFQIWTRNHHSPWMAMFCNALYPEARVFSLSTPHAPNYWRPDQRPLPDNLFVADDSIINVHDDEVILLHTPMDIHSWSEHRGRKVYVAHNMATFDGGNNVAFTLNTYGVPMVAISEMKAQSWRDAGYKGEITVILPYVNVEDYGGWTGEGGYILTVCNGLDRPLFDKAAWLEATRDLPVKLVGSGNEGIRGAVGPAQSWEDLKSLYRCAAVYLNPTVAPNEDAWNLSMLEAAATGVPIATMHAEDGGLAFLVRGNREDMGMFMATAGAPVMHEGVSPLTRSNVATRFPLDKFRRSWLDVLERVTA